MVVAGCLRGITALMVNFPKTMEEGRITCPFIILRLKSDVNLHVCLTRRPSNLSGRLSVRPEGHQPAGTCPHRGEFTRGHIQQDRRGRDVLVTSFAVGM